MTRLEMMELGWRKRRGMWWLPRFLNDQPMITIDTTPTPKLLGGIINHETP